MEECDRAEEKRRAIEDDDDAPSGSGLSKLWLGKENKSRRIQKPIKIQFFTWNILSILFINVNFVIINASISTQAILFPEV